MSSDAATWPYLDHPDVLAIAHRGGAGDWPENTLPAFQNAADLGYRYLETDVHCTSDGVLLAFHDERLDRVTDRTGLIREMTHEQAVQATVRGEPIPTMAELFEAFPNHRFNIDCKHDSSVAALVALLVEHEAFDRVCVGGFSDARLKRLRSEAGPKLCTSMGPKAILALRLASWRVPLPVEEVAAVQIPPKDRGIRILDKALVKAAHGRGLHVHVWTIDDADEMHRCLDLGVDGIMTDRPAVLKHVLIERGQWTSTEAW